MSEPLLLFVYGLLMVGESGYAALDLEARTRRRGPERVSGRLHHLGDYPGLILGPQGFAHGELLELLDPATLSDLDVYELYDPENPEKSEFCRTEVQLLESGALAFVYVYNRSVLNRPIIATGNWRRR